MLSFYIFLVFFLNHHFNKNFSSPCTQLFSIFNPIYLNLHFISFRGFHISIISHHYCPFFDISNPASNSSFYQNNWFLFVLNSSPSEFDSIYLSCFSNFQLFFNPSVFLVLGFPHPRTQFIQAYFGLNFCIDYLFFYV